jgi:hypothetical protein
VQPLAEKRRVIAVDMQGPGRTGEVPNFAQPASLISGWGGSRQVSDARVVESPFEFLERAMGIEPTSQASETTRPDSVVPWPSFHAAKSSVRECRKGRVKLAVSVHCSPPQPFRDPPGRKSGFRPFLWNRWRAIHWVAQSPKETVLRFLFPPLTSMVDIVLLSSAILIGGVGGQDNILRERHIGMSLPAWSPRFLNGLARGTVLGPLVWIQ